MIRDTRDEMIRAMWTDDKPLKVIVDALVEAGFVTPRGLPWTKKRLCVHAVKKLGLRRREHRPASADPTPADVRAMCAEFRRGWSADERERRRVVRVGGPVAWSVPHVDLTHLVDGFGHGREDRRGAA